MGKVQKDKDRTLLNINRGAMEMPMDLFSYQQLIKDNKKLLHLLAKQGV